MSQNNSNSDDSGTDSETTKIIVEISPSAADPDNYLDDVDPVEAVRELLTEGEAGAVLDALDASIDEVDEIVTGQLASGDGTNLLNEAFPDVEVDAFWEQFTDDKFENDLDDEIESDAASRREALRTRNLKTLGSPEHEIVAGVAITDGGDVSDNKQITAPTSQTLGLVADLAQKSVPVFTQNIDQRYLDADAMYGGDEESDSEAEAEAEVEAVA